MAVNVLIFEINAVFIITGAKRFSHIQIVFSHCVKLLASRGVLFPFSNKTTPPSCHETYWSGDKNQTPSYVVLQLSSLSACFPSLVWLAYLFPSNPCQPSDMKHPVLSTSILSLSK